MNFVLMRPGTPAPLFPKTLAMKAGVKTYPVDGQMYLLTVYVTNPETKVLGVEVLGCWIWGDCVVLPRSVVYEKDTNNKREIAAGTKEMKQSQSAALTAASAAIKKHFPAQQLRTLTNRDLKVSLEDVGGPSGGLIFTLGLIDLLTPDNLAAGRKIAGTGTMDSKGHVGAIGGVTEKIEGAKKVHASLLFVPRENCSDLPASVSGISVLAVDSIDQAMAYLLAKSHGNSKLERELNSDGIHGCANLGA